MKTTRKLIPALAMLLISAVMMSTASFAWFSMSTSVAVTGMQVQATASKNLMISENQASDYGANVDFETAMSQLVPCSTVGGSNPSFFKLNNVGTGMSQDSYASADSTTFTTANVGTDYLKKTVYIKCVGDAASNLSATIVTDGQNKALDPSLRVMLVIGGSAYIYTPIANAAYGVPGQAVSAVDPTQKKVLADISSLVNDDDATVDIILDALTKDQAYQVDIYIWYEGEDINCTASNAVDLAATSFTINFLVE